jgi:hypothetical protein
MLSDAETNFTRVNKLREKVRGELIAEIKTYSELTGDPIETDEGENKDDDSGKDDE